jgi:ribosome maturation factor RimP
MGKKKDYKAEKKGHIRPVKRLSPEQGKQVADRVEKIASIVCADEEIELVHVEFLSEAQQLYLRVYIDKPGGVTMADCATVSRQLGDLLDVKMNLDDKYRLEVSSPGIYRPLYKKADYVRFKGKTVDIRTHKAVHDKKKFTGVLEGILENDKVSLSVDGNTVEIDYSSIKSARLAENNGDDRC